MIRFIDLGEQICEGTREFAFFDTTTDTFMNFDGDQAFESWKEFVESHTEWLRGSKGSRSPLDRFEHLCPEWVKNSQSILPRRTDEELRSVLRKLTNLAGHPYFPEVKDLPAWAEAIQEARDIL